MWLDGLARALAQCLRVSSRAGSDFFRVEPQEAQVDKPDCHPCNTQLINITFCILQNAVFCYREDSLKFVILDQGNDQTNKSKFFNRIIKAIKGVPTKIISISI